VGSSYKAEVLTTMIVGELDGRPRGTAQRLAEALDVKPQTVAKWRRGETLPEQERWPALEAFFDWPAGEIARQVVPALGHDTTVDLVINLTEQVQALSDRLAAVEARLPARRPGRAR
jgi:hypothetical protein